MKKSRHWKRDLVMFKNLAYIIGSVLLAVTLVTPSACKAPACKAPAGVDVVARDGVEVVAIDIAPSGVTIGQNVTVSAQVRNTSNDKSTRSVSLSLDGDIVQTKEVTLSPMSSEIVTFTLAIDSFGAHEVAVDGSTATVTVVPLYIMKGVGIDVPQEDFEAMRAVGIDIVTTNWGMGESVEGAEDFLDKAEASGLKVVMDGGFSDAAWGFTKSDWDNLPKGKRPVWQRDKVQSWIKALKDHPAVFGWDISNEAGMNLPSGDRAKNSEWPRSAITVKQLKQARADILEIDPDKPILIRMAPWGLNEVPFGASNPFGKGIADIVMLNIYSNYAPGKQVLSPNIIQENGSEYIKEIKSVDADVKIWVSIGAFEEPGIFKRPTVYALARDIENTLELSHITGIGFYLWGPVFLGDGETWYLPETGADLWSVIQRHIQTGQVSAQTAPDPSPKVIDIHISPEEVHLGDYVEITVEAKNDGGTANWQTTTVSFPQNPSDISVIGHNLTDAGVFPRGYIAWRDYGTSQDCELTYPLAEGYRAPWPAGDAGYLTVKVKPQVCGEFKFYVKTVAGRQPDGKCVSWDPASGEKDQQGEFVYERTIRVLP